MKVIKTGISIAITAFCITAFQFRVSADQSIMVKDDFGKGVKSNIFVAIGDENEAKGVTDDSGVLLFETACLQGKQIKACPVSPLYYEGIVDCRPNKDKLVVNVTKKAFVKNLKVNAEKFEAKGKSGNAALVYSEIAARYYRINPEEATVARNKAYMMFADAIETPSNVSVVNFDKNQKIVVLTNEFVSYLKDYQRENGVPVTGVIDYKTLSTRSDISIGEMFSYKMSKEPFENK